MKLIPLTQGKVALVDDEDFDWLSSSKWCAIRQGKDPRIRWYAVTSPARGRALAMHRMIMDPPEGMLVDHIDGNGLDNQKNNMRLATHAQNMMNAGPTKGRKYKGVFWSDYRSHWVSAIGYENRRLHLGNFHTAEEAALAYNDAARGLHGEFAYLNVIL